MHVRSLPRIMTLLGLFTVTAGVATPGPATPEAGTPVAGQPGVVAYCQDPAAYPDGPAGVPAFVIPRACDLLGSGADPVELAEVWSGIPADTLPGDPAYVDPLVAAGDRHVAAAESAEASGDDETAAAAYGRAAGFYFVARFPTTLTPASEAAYGKSVAAHEAAGRYLSPPIEVIRIPFEGREIVAHLRVPDGEAPAPVVLVLGGIDVWKGEMNGFTDPFLAQGMVTVAVDVPGTGQSAGVPLDGAGDRYFAALIDALGERSDLDATRLGVYGLSFGGYWSTRLALSNPEVDAAVNIGGPIRDTFTPGWCPSIPTGTLLTLAHTAGLSFPELGPAGTCDAIDRFGLDALGLLAAPSGSTPILSVNGGRDPLVDPADAYVLTGLGYPQDTVTFAQDGHVAGANLAVHLPLSVAWLRDRLGA